MTNEPQDDIEPPRTKQVKDQWHEAPPLPYRYIGSYESPPLEPAFTVPVKYVYVGELQPMPYPLEERETR